MWLVTNTGFYSTAVDKNDASRIMVRARVRADLTRLLEEIGMEAEIVATLAGADYPFRVFLDRHRFAAGIASLIDEMDYTSFSTSVDHKLGRTRARLYKRAWVIFAELDPRASRSEGLSEAEVAASQRPHSGAVEVARR